MKFQYGALLLSFSLAAGCIGFPRVEVSYQGNGDAAIRRFMHGNYMSNERGIAEDLKGHLEEGRQAGQVIDKPYLIQRGAICIDGTPAVCKFNGIADERFRGIPKENAERAHRVINIEARVSLLQTASVEVIKEESYPNPKTP